MRGEQQAGVDEGGSREVAGVRPVELARVTAIIGPYGSGKTELAISLALETKARSGEIGISKIALADLDVLKPYFRSREAADVLAAAGVELIAPKGALANTDLPILPAELRGSIGRSDARIIMDVGGDPVGARALGSLSDVVGAAGYDLLLVINRNRPFAESFENVMALAEQIMGACQLEITGVVSNTHLMEETTIEDVRGGLDLSRQVATALGVDVRLVMVPEGLSRIAASLVEVPPVVTVRRHMKPEFMGGVVLKPARLPYVKERGSHE